jgi:two-component system CheB/CheR fusion protein
VRVEDTGGGEPGSRERTFARVVAAAAASIGATVLVGWTADHPALTALGSGISMKANAAICFLLVGGALWRRASRRDPAGDRIAFVLGMTATVIGGFTLLEHLAGVDLHIDQVLSREPPGMPGTAAPGRMGPPAATSFVLLGTALAAMRGREPAARLAVQLLGLATAFLAVLPLVGYAYGTTALFGLARYTGIAFPTAVLLEGIALAVLAVARGAGLMSALRGVGPEARLARRTLVYSTVVPLTVGWLVALGLRRGTYDGVFAVSFLVLALILSITLLTWRDVLHIARVARQREAAEAARAESEREVRARAAELQVALDRLREADERKDAFLAMLSHELRNPLAPIANGVFLLRRTDAGTEPGRRALAVIERQVAHLIRLVEDLLDVARISRGKVQLRRSRMDLVDLARRTAEDHAASASSAGLVLTVALPDGPLWVDGDPTRLAQVVGDLLSNAVKFTPPGGAVTLSVAQETGGTAVLRVGDTGVGLDAAMRARIFEPFVQADATLDRSRGGLGLGLALVKGLVELHGGAVEARSEGAGRGTELVVRLPLDAAPAGPDREAGPGRGEAPLRILVVEDNADAAETLRLALELLGHEVEVAHDGEQGLAAARHRRPDVVLCDIGLPGIDGYAVARALRAGGDTCDVSLIAVTGYASPEERRRAIDAGFDHHFGKPADLEKLTGVLEAVARPPAARLAADRRRRSTDRA